MANIQQIVQALRNPEQPSSDPLVMPQEESNRVSRFRDLLIPYLLKGAIDSAKVPGKVFQGDYNVKPQTPGLWSEEDEFRQSHAQQQQVEEAGGLAMNTMGSGLPFASKGAAGMGGGKLTAPIRAHHASPHKFDRFDISKVGTGQGAQTFGHGLYFAEHPQTMDSYFKSFSSGMPWQYKLGGRDPTPAEIAELNKKYVSPVYLDSLKIQNKGEPDFGLFQGQKVEAYRPNAHRYEVNIHAKPEEFLDWDTRIEHQPPVVKNKLSQMGFAVDPKEPGFDVISGQDAYRRLHSWNNPPSYATAALKEAGIPGIKYKDAGSRQLSDAKRAYYQQTLDKIDETLRRYPDNPELREHRVQLEQQLRAFQPTYNYVVGNDQIIDILKRYGVGSVAALPPAVQMMLPQTKDQNEQ